MARSHPQITGATALGWRDRLQRLIDLGIPSDGMSPAPLRRTRTISVVTVVMIGVAFLATLQAWAVGKWEVVSYLAIATAAGIGNLVLLRATRNPSLAGHVAVAILAALISASALSSGGFYNPSFAWLYILPLTAAVALDLRGAALWTGVTLCVAVAFWLLPELGVHLVDRTPPELRELNALVVRGLTIVAIGAIGVGFVIGHQRTANELDRESTYLELVMHAAVSANQARSFEEALGDALERICTAMQWVAGHALEVGEDGTSRSMGIVHSGLPECTRLEELSRKRVFAMGDGLPGRAVATGVPQIVTDLHWRERREPGPSQERGMAARSLGLAAAFAVPVFVRGRPRAVLEFASPRPLPDPERLLEVFTHIAVQLGRVVERTELQERIRQTQKMEAIGQLAAGLAHEINNPMSFVRSNLHSLRERNLSTEKEQRDPAELQELIDDSLDGVERTISIVRDVMQFSRLGGGGPTAWEPADVNELLSDSLRVASSDVPAAVHFELDCAEVPRVRCAANGLRQVFLNLIVNAVQAVGSAGTIRLRTRNEAGEVVVRVEDDGPGMSARDREKLFDPFFTTKPVGQGTGLGLTVSYEIVQAHGGTIRVESEPGRGASFEVRLPLEGSDREDAIQEV